MSRLRSGEALVFGVATAAAPGARARRRVRAPRARARPRPARARAAPSRSSPALAGLLAFPRLRPGLRAALAFSFGGLGLVNGMLHVIHMPTARRRRRRPHRRARRRAPALVLLGLAASRSRGGIAASARAWRWPACSPCPPACSPAFFVLGPVALGIVATHKWREPVGDPPSAATASVSFKASDGLDSPAGTGRRENGAAVARRARRQQRPQGLGRPRLDARPPRLRRPALRRPRARRERRHAEQLRLGLGQGRRRRARVPQAPRRRRPASASARSASRPAPTSCSRSPAQRDDLAAAGHRRRGRRLVPGLAPPPGLPSSAPCPAG